MITLVVVTDGRDCVFQTVESALAHLHGPITQNIIYDDSDDSQHRCELGDRFPEFIVAYSSNGRQGFGGAVRHMWKHLAAYDPNPYLFWLEDDFTFNRDVDLDAMMHVLAERPTLLQLVLRRQPWNNEERAAGGIVECHPDDYTDCHDGQNDWLEHRKFWSTNPHLTRMAITKVGWPDDPHSEGTFGQRMLVNPDTRFGFWGTRADRPWVTHIGKERVGTGY